MPRGSGGGSHDGFAIGYNPEFEKDEDHYISRLHHVHETSHSFWRHAGHAETWIDEGLADTFSHMYAIENGAGPGLWKQSRRDCEHHDLKMLSDSPPAQRSIQYYCHYYLGQQLFLELQNNLTPEEFTDKLRELYLLSRDMEAAGETAGIAEVRQLFPGQAQIIDKHWNGALNAPENRAYDEYRFSGYSHDLIQWNQYPTYDGQMVAFRGSLLADSVLLSRTLAEANSGYSNFQLRSIDGQFVGNIEPPSRKGQVTSVEYLLEGKYFHRQVSLPTGLRQPV